MAAAGDTLDDEVDALYALAPGDFVAARDALVRRLRAEKRRDDATRVAALRRPTVVAWALNQAAREAPGDVDAVLAATAAATDAQRDVMSGGDPARLRAATRQRRDAVSALARRASAVLRQRGGAGTASDRLDEITATVEAAAGDPELTATLRAGRLDRELEAPAAFGVFALGDAVAPPPARTTSRRTARAVATSSDDDDAAAAAGAARVAAARRELERRQAEERDAAAGAAAARAAADDAAADVDRLTRELRAAEQEAGRRARAAEQAEAAAARAVDARRRAEADLGADGDDDDRRVSPR